MNVRQCPNTRDCSFFFHSFVVLIFFCLVSHHPLEYTPEACWPSIWRHLRLLLLTISLASRAIESFLAHDTASSASRSSNPCKKLQKTVSTPATLTLHAYKHLHYPLPKVGKLVHFMYQLLSLCGPQFHNFVLLLWGDLSIY